MPSIRALGGIALAVAMLAGCDSIKPYDSTSPIGLTSGTVQDQLRQQQLQNAKQNPGIQNPVATGVNPGVGGIERQGAGSGSAGGTVAGLNTDGTINRPDSGAPSTQSMPRKRKKPAATPAAETKPAN